MSLFQGSFGKGIIDVWRLGKILLISSLEIVQELIDTLRDFRIALPEELILDWQHLII